MSSGRIISQGGEKVRFPGKFLIILCSVLFFCCCTQLQSDRWFDGGRLERTPFLAQAQQAPPPEDTCDIWLEPDEIGVKNPQVEGGHPLAPFGLHSSINTWIPFVFKIPSHDKYFVKEAVLEVTISGIDSNGDGQWDDLPETDTVEACGKKGRSSGEVLIGNFSKLYKPGENPQIPKTLTIDLLKFPSIKDVLEKEEKLNMVVEDDSNCLGAKLHLVLAPEQPGTARAAVQGARKECVPTDAYVTIPEQKAAGDFPLIKEQLHTIIRCKLDLDVVLKPAPTTRTTAPVEVTVTDSFSPGLFFDKYVSSNYPTSVESYANNVVTFKPIRLELPPQTAYQRFPISIQYDAFPNDLAGQRAFEQNGAAIAIRDTQTGNIILRRPIQAVRIYPITPRLQILSSVSSSAGLPGDRKTFTIVVYNTGDIFLSTVKVDAEIPDNMTADPKSISGGKIAGRKIKWDAVGPVNVGSSIAYSFDATIDANTKEGQILSMQSFATATTPNFNGAGTRALNAVSNKVSVLVSPIQTGIDLTLSAALVRPASAPSPSPAASETPAPSKALNGFFPNVFIYTAKVTNTGKIPLDQVSLQLNQATLALPVNPQFPFKLDGLNPGESKTVEYRGRIGPSQRGALIDTASVSGRPVNNGVQVAPEVQAVARVTVRVLPPIIMKLTPANASPGNRELELIVEGAAFVPGAVVSFQPSEGITVIPPTPPDFGFEGPGMLKVKLNVADSAQAGERQVFVSNPSGESGGARPYNVFIVNPGGSSGTSTGAGTGTSTQTGNKPGKTIFQYVVDFIKNLFKKLFS